MVYRSAPRINALQIRSFNIAPVWTRLLNPKTVFTFGGFVRQDQFNYYPSDNPFADLTPDPGFAGVGQSASIAQNRRLTNLGGRASVSYISGVHNIKVGVQYEHTFITERDTFGLVDPTGNAPCLNPDGTPDTNPLITSQAGCTGGLQPNTGQGLFANGDPVPAFQPILGCYDLTRTGPLPASDGCPNGTSGEYKFYGHADIKEFAFFAQDSITLHNWTFNLGVRFDKYNGIASAAQGEPRLGSPTISKEPTPFCGPPMPVPWKVHSTRTWCWRVSDVLTQWLLPSSYWSQAALASLQHL
jgi:outer membrane receptor protein involved in Fe transport